MWASRWDTYLAMSDVQIHWFAIINSVVIVLFLSGKNVAYVVYRHTSLQSDEKVSESCTFLFTLPNFHV